MAFPVTTYKLKQTDFSHNISVVRFPPNLDGNLGIGWHVEDLDSTVLVIEDNDNVGD